MTDVNGCSAISNVVNVAVHYPFNGEEICIVTVDPNSGKNIVAWERTKNMRIAYYNVYKELSLIMIMIDSSFHGFLTI